MHPLTLDILRGCLPAFQHPPRPATLGLIELRGSGVETNPFSACSGSVPLMHEPRPHGTSIALGLSGRSAPESLVFSLTTVPGPVAKLVAWTDAQAATNIQILVSVVVKASS